MAATTPPTALPPIIARIRKLENLDYWERVGKTDVDV